jgi:hypothetical protein
MVAIVFAGSAFASAASLTASLDSRPGFHVAAFQLRAGWQLAPRADGCAPRITFSAAAAAPSVGGALGRR